MLSHKRLVKKRERHEAAKRRDRKRGAPGRGTWLAGRGERKRQARRDWMAETFRIMQDRGWI